MEFYKVRLLGIVGFHLESVEQGTMYVCVCVSGSVAITDTLEATIPWVDRR